MPKWNDVKANPSLVSQQSGCCGFAAVLMALLVRKSKVVDQLVACATTAKEFKRITKSTRVHERLLKRKRAGIVTGIDDFDQQLCLALMILFKEYCKQKGSLAWEACLTYSTLWSWAYSSMTYTKTTDGDVLNWLSFGMLGTAPVTTTGKPTKLKDIPEGAVVTHDDLSYKKGDLALPATSVPELLGMVDLSVAAQAKLVTDTVFSGFDGKAPSAVRSGALKTFHDELNDVQTKGSASSHGYADVILGVGNKPTETKFNAYDNVTHWVYLPAKPNSKPGKDEIHCWTWGAEQDLWASIAGKGFYPAYALYLNS
jgi:hypothetical protein